MVASRLLDGDFVGGEMVGWRYDRKRCKNSHIGYSNARASHFLGHLFAATELLRKHKETIFFSFSVLYLDAVLESLTSEKKFFAKLRSELLFNSLFPILLPRFAHTFRAPRVVFAGKLVGKSIAIFFVLLTHQNSK